MFGTDIGIFGVKEWWMMIRPFVLADASIRNLYLVQDSLNRVEVDLVASC